MMPNKLPIEGQLDVWCKMHGPRLALCCSAVVFFYSLIGGWWCFDSQPFENDDTSYLFQAKLFAAGKLVAPAPPHPGFVPSYFNFHVGNGVLASFYPFGNALFLAAGVLLGFPPLIPALLSAATTWLVFLLTSRVFGATVACVAVFLTAVSPATGPIGLSLFSENTCRFLLALFLYSCLRVFDLGNHPTSTERFFPTRLLYILVAGISLALALNTRPLTAGAIAGGVALLVLLRSLFSGRFLRDAWRGLLIAPPVILGLLLFFGWNKVLTGDWRKSPYNNISPPGSNSEFQPEDSLFRSLLNRLPVVGYTAMGLGYLNPGDGWSFLPWTDVAGGVVIGDLDQRKWVAVRATRKYDAVELAWHTGTEELVARVGVGKRARPWGEVSLRVRVEGDSVAVYYRPEREEEWRTLDTKQIQGLPVRQVGFFSMMLAPFGSPQVAFDNPSICFDSEPGKLACINTAEPKLALEGPFRIEGVPPKSFSITANGFSVTPAPSTDLWDRTRASFFLANAESKAVTVETTIRLRAFDPMRTWYALFLDLNNSLLHLLAALIPIVCSVWVICCSAYRSAATGLFGVVAAAPLIAYGFWPQEFWAGGVVPHCVRYFNEGIILGIIPLTAAAFVDVALRFFQFCKSRDMMRVFQIVALLYAGNILVTHYRVLELYRELDSIGRYRPSIQSQLRELGIEKGVVFVYAPNNTSIPVGDFPAKSIEEAQMIYFRLGSLAEWRESYRQFFQGKVPYLYNDGKISRLPSDI